MKTKLEKEAEDRGYKNTVIDAMAVSEALYELPEYDVYLLGPQVRYAMNDVKKLAGNKPVIQISTSDFGLMKADSVFNSIVKALEN